MIKIFCCKSHISFLFKELLKTYNVDAKKKKKMRKRF